MSVSLIGFVAVPILFHIVYSYIVYSYSVLSGEKYVMLHIEYSVRRNILLLCYKPYFVRRNHYQHATVQCTYHILLGGILLLSYILVPYLVSGGILLLSYILVPYLVRRNIIIILHTRTLFC